ncbi:hypothetical protein D9611_003915 [Ephemerocybe angulata]|uniref:PH domain-containing protein n=1 Tax=Ephemerocybe angulata TaxID=980116 RepID=A0A8H5B844_9AGAR|nr:hypothetical protein D9611_003915 [Tulosesus angulatus]
MGPRPMATEHAQSAKTLISEYERYSSHRRPSPSAALAARRPQSSTTTSTTTASASFYPAPRPASLPLKHSFKNLLGLLKKGTTGLRDRSDKSAPFPVVAAAKRTSTTDLLLSRKELPLLPLPLGDADRPILSRSQTQTGALVYLAGDAHWTFCTISLQESIIRVSWLHPDGSPCTRDISLLGCSDIRSLSNLKAGLEPAEWDALQDIKNAAVELEDKEEMKVFELLFQNSHDRRKRERFAVATVRERAKWISAFWDAILPNSQDPTRHQHEPADNIHTRMQSKEREKSQPFPIETPQKTRPRPPDLTLASSQISTRTDRSLPPLPISRAFSTVPAPLTIRNKSHSTASSPTITPGMARTGTNASSASNTLLVATHGKLPAPISPASAYSSSSGFRILSPSRFVATSPQPLVPARRSGWPQANRVGGNNSIVSSSPPNVNANRSGGEKVQRALSSSSTQSEMGTLASPSSLVRRANSASITNLSRLSVVKERLKQIERSESERAAWGISGGSGITGRGGTAGRGGIGVSQTRSRSNSTKIGSPGSKSVGRGSEERDPDARSGEREAGSQSQPGQGDGRAQGLLGRGDEHVRASVRGIGSGGDELEKDESKSNEERMESLLNLMGEQPVTDGLPQKGSLIGNPHPNTLVDEAGIVDRLETIRSALGTGVGPNVREIALGLDHQLKGAREMLGQVKDAVGVLEGRLTSSNPGHTSELGTVTTQKEGVDLSGDLMRVLLGVKKQLSGSLPALEERVKEVQAQQEQLVRLDNERSAGAVGATASRSAGANSEAMGEMGKRLEELVGLSRETATVVRGGGGKEVVKEVRAGFNGGLYSLSRRSEAACASGQLAAILTHIYPVITHLAGLMEADRAHREQQLLQQADSVRYLNELNTWLEAFVNSGSSHIQGLAASVDMLCADLGGTGAGAATLLGDVRQLVLGMKARDQSMASLQAAVNDLVVSVGSEMGRVGGDSNALAQMIEVQKREQESMLKVFTDEISDEIKGERLRFVEAMREATAINVQSKFTSAIPYIVKCQTSQPDYELTANQTLSAPLLISNRPIATDDDSNIWKLHYQHFGLHPTLHVEELKKEMGKEVFVMAQEVERLHRDKQEVEHRIAELMAFYSKQTPPPLAGLISMSNNTTASGGSHRVSEGSAVGYMPAERQRAGANQASSNQRRDMHPSASQDANSTVVQLPNMKPVVDLRMRPLGSSGGASGSSRQRHPVQGGNGRRATTATTNIGSGSGSHPAQRQSSTAPGSSQSRMRPLPPPRGSY